jgi:hypothetical protein
LGVRCWFAVRLGLGESLGPELVRGRCARLLPAFSVGVIGVTILMVRLF